MAGKIGLGKNKDKWKFSEKIGVKITQLVDTFCT